MLRGRRVLFLFASLILCLVLSAVIRLDVEASSKKEYLDSLSVGISQIVYPTMDLTDKR